MGKGDVDLWSTLITIFMTTSDFIRYRQVRRINKLRKPKEEDDWKAVFGKTERTV